MPPRSSGTPDWRRSMIIAIFVIIGTVTIAEITGLLDVLMIVLSGPLDASTEELINALDNIVSPWWSGIATATPGVCVLGLVLWGLWKSANESPTTR